MTKYVISGYIGFDNFGDEAIAKVLTTHLKDINAEKITVLSSNPIKTSELYVAKNLLVFFPEHLHPYIYLSDICRVTQAGDSSWSC